MFLPNLIPDDAHLLWIDGMNTSGGLNFLRKRRLLGNNSYRKSNSQQQQSANSATTRYYTESNYRGVQFAPPLSSYLSANVGATISTNIQNDNLYSNNIDGAMISSCGSQSSGSAFDDDIETRYAYLNSIKTFGYSYMKPLGISKTMQKMIEEEHDAGNNTNNLQENNTEQSSQLVQDETVENVTNGNTNHIANDAEDVEVDNEAAVQLNGQTEIEEAPRQDIDLDADIPDLDGSNANLSFNSFNEEGESDTHEEDEYAEININDYFMAEEEEYYEYRDFEPDSTNQNSIDHISDNIGNNAEDNSNSINNVAATNNSMIYMGTEGTLGLPKIRTISTSTRISSLGSSKSFSETGMTHSSSRNASDYYSRISNHTDLLQIHSADVFSLIQSNNNGNSSTFPKDKTYDKSSLSVKFSDKDQIEDNAEDSDMEIDD